MKDGPRDRRVFESILELLPGVENPTPLVRIPLKEFPRARVYGKLEWMNPFGAVKDRIAWNMVLRAEEAGLLEGKKLVEPTSGNTGIGLALIGNLKKYGLKTPLSSELPSEKKSILRFLGSDVVEVSDSLCPDPDSPSGAIGVAKGIVKRFPEEFHMLNQYENEANIEAHYLTTGPEIWRQSEGRITHFVAGLGTCGTVTGVGRFLKGKREEVKIIGVHPEEGHHIPGVRSLKQLEVTRLFKPEEYDGLVEVSNREGYEACLWLNRELGIIAGPSSGMALAGLRKVLSEEEDAVVVVLFPDNIFKYGSYFEKEFPDIFPAGKGGITGKDGEVDDLIETARNEYNTIEVEAAKDEIVRGDVRVIDVRPSFQYKQGHIPGADNIPVRELVERKEELPADRNGRIILVCQVGNASLRGVIDLLMMGYRNVVSLNGGTKEWAEKGLEISVD